MTAARQALMRPGRYCRTASTALLLLVYWLFGADGLLDSANSLYNTDRTAEAIAMYRKAALEGENPALCYFNMANAYFRMDSVPQSIVYYKACINVAPRFFRGYLNLAIAYHALDEMGACIAAAYRALSLEPDDKKTLMVLAASYRKAGAYPEAVATFEQIVQRYPENEEAYVALAEMYRELKDPDEAAEWLLRYPQEGKNEGYVNTLLADIYQSRGEPERALFHLEKAFEQDPGNRWVFYRKVMLLSRMGNSLVALEEARRGIELMPKFAELALLGGNLAFEIGEYGQAERLYTIARDNGSPGAVVGLENVRVVRLKRAREEEPAF